MLLLEEVVLLPELREMPSHHVLYLNNNLNGVHLKTLGGRAGLREHADASVTALKPA